MAASKGDQPRKKDSMPPGVRGPGGPPPPPGSAGSGASSERPMMGAQSAAPSTGRKRFEELSFPLIRTLHGMPRWLIVVAPAILLFGGLILTGPLAWLGGILLFVVWLLHRLADRAVLAGADTRLAGLPGAGGGGPARHRRPQVHGTVLSPVTWF